MVLQAEEQGAGCQAQDVVGGYVAVFPGERFDISEDWVAFLAGRDDDAAGSGAFGEGLRFGLDDACFGGVGGCGLPVEIWI